MHYDLEKIKDFLIAHRTDYIDERPDSLLELLYLFYKEYSIIDNEIIRRQYDILDTCLAALSLEEQDTVSDLLCVLCTEHERAAFVQGLQLGAGLVFELQS